MLTVAEHLGAPDTTLSALHVLHGLTSALLHPLIHFYTNPHTSGTVAGAGGGSTAGTRLTSDPRRGWVPNHRGTDIETRGTRNCLDGVGLQVDRGTHGERGQCVRGRCQASREGDAPHRGQRLTTNARPAGHCWNDRTPYGPREDNPECERENRSAPGAPCTPGIRAVELSGLRITARGSLPPPAHSQRLYSERLAYVYSSFQRNVDAIMINIHLFKTVLNLQELFLQYR